MVHKAILVAASPYFEKVLEGENAEESELSWDEETFHTEEKSPKPSVNLLSFQGETSLVFDHIVQWM